MIAIEDVSADIVLRYVDNITSSSAYIAGVESIQDLKKYINDNPNNPNNSDMNQIISEIEKKLEKINNKEHSLEPIKYKVRDYQNIELNRQNIINCGDALILTNPTDVQITYRLLKNKTIKQIISDLAHTLPDGKNFVEADNYYYLKMGTARVQKIIQGIEMFEDQIERQAKLTASRDINLFKLNYEEKKVLVKEYYKNIIEYLVENTTKAFVWSNLTKRQKQLYLSSIKATSKWTQYTQQNVINYISNYITILELENIKKHDYKVLSRFIIK